ncbi:hypothetical protein [Nonomuraea salmonea]|uniref:hypothetical protein n=1 Tax=Nonomuraea salmonea TaxID=46181 RepID=UPI002FE7B52E
MIGAQDPDFADTPEKGSGAAMEVYAYANQLAAQRKANPRNDIVTRLLQPNENGETLAEDEFDLFVLLLVVAGNETTRNAASGGMLAFFEHPDQWDRLVADPALAKTAADEIVRWVSPVNLFRRTSTADQVLGGPGDQGGRQGRRLLRLRQPRHLRLPGRRRLRHRPRPEPAHRLRRRRRPLLPRQPPRQTGTPHPLRAVGPPPPPTSTSQAPPRRLRSNFINGLKELPVTIG